MENNNENPTYILCIETANTITSVSVSENGNCLHTKEVLETNKAADVLHKLTEELLAEINLSFNDLNAVAISEGPGSYTGLRIAASAAKGYCFALDIPLIAIPTLKAMVYGIQNRYHQTDFDIYMPMIDARRMEVFTSLFFKNLSIMQAFTSLIINEDFETIFDKDKRYLLFGNGAIKTQNNLIADTTILFTTFTPSSKDLCLLAFSAYQQNKFESIAYFEPNYTKPFYTTANK